ncbi:calcium-binding protein [Thalassovita taeanensis]|uniref:Hemolysin-type calcium-binding repeat-containing protein n=1 Tax=Thalassovita taeanensis TaxID=657014 RepID=A0A1H9KYD7_9RHOB|nr:nidogen-like domain-containing protein [Thalassovita taeanensis]SER04088.1 Hemolysin-type calcium-binding repeat-containing protein [Thalassovita taeanensis]
MPVTGNGVAQTGLGGAEGYGETAIPRSDDGSLELDLSGVFEGGLNYFGVFYDASSVFVNTNGTLSFVSPLPTYPTADNVQITQDVIAPFWGDVDTRLDGEGAESGGIWVDIDTGTDTVTITWDDVGVYRRNATVSNTFQLQLIDQGGGDFDIVFRYEHIGWTIGSGLLDTGAQAGLASARLPEPEWIETPPDSLATTTGNTGAIGLWGYEMRGGTLGELALATGLILHGSAQSEQLVGTEQDDILSGLEGADTLLGGGGADRLDGGAGDDILSGGDGNDTLIGGDGNDWILAGDTQADLRDIVYGGNGDDTIDGSYGNDELRGDVGNDVIAGSYGVDTVIGGDGDDQLTGQAWSDEIFGGNGNDFINGGFGYDRVNGGAGADRFFHLGVTDHGSDWIQDYSAADGDVLHFGAAATVDQFQANFSETTDAGQLGVQEAFIIYIPTQQIIWALVDGGGQNEINLRLAGVDYDLLAW